MAALDALVCCTTKTLLSIVALFIRHCTILAATHDDFCASPTVLPDSSLRCIDPLFRIFLASSSHPSYPWYPWVQLLITLVWTIAAEVWLTLFHAPSWLSSFATLEPAPDSQPAQNAPFRSKPGYTCRCRGPSDANSSTLYLGTIYRLQAMVRSIFYGPPSIRENSCLPHRP